MQPKEFITDYLRVFSGHSKPAEMLRRYVADEKLIAHIQQVEAAFPKYSIQAEDIVAERDKVAVRASFRGVQQGDFAGVKATGRSVSASLIIIYRVENNRIVDHWMQVDSAGLLQQLQLATAAA